MRRERNGMRSGGFGFNGRCAYITSPDGMVHTAPQTGSRSKKKKRGANQYKPLPGEDITICLKCEKADCDGGVNCPMVLVEITPKEYEQFQEWMFGFLRSFGGVRDVHKLTGISWQAINDMIAGNYPHIRVQRKIKRWLDNRDTE